MSQKINPVSIGLFIVIGLALGVAGILMFSSGRLFSKTREVIVYFDDSLNGLSEGAPVKYRGVTIGSVKRVMVRFNQATNDFAMPVILELDQRLVRQRVGDATDVLTEATTEEHIKSGLRASLQTESLVTGVLYVDIRFNPRAPPPVFHQVENYYMELPSESTDIQQLFENLASIDLKGIEQRLNALLSKLDRAVSGLQIEQINQGVTNLLLSFDRLVSSGEITNALGAVQATLAEYRSLGARLNARVDPLADSLTNSLAEVNLTLGQFRATAENLRSMLGPQSALNNNLDQTLEELSLAAQSISTLMEFLNQHPNALITGRERSRTKQP